MYTSDIDYPACHSMDTDWFAIDKNGHVALMISDEPGAIPLCAEREGWCKEILARNLEQIDKKIYQLTIEDAAISNIENLCIGNKEAIEYDEFEGFFIVKEGVKFQELNIYTLVTRQNSDIDIFSLGRNIYYVELMFVNGADTLLKQDVDSGKIIHLFQTEEMYEVNNEDDYKKTFEYLIGLYMYEADYSEIYTRKGIPDNPLSVSKLFQNGELADIEAIDFAEKRELNPMQYISCTSWNTNISPTNSNYCIINIGNNETATVRISNEYLLNEKIMPYCCDLCYPEKKKTTRNFFHQQIDLQSDYPRIMFLSDYPRKNFDRSSKLDLSALQINPNTVYASFVVKCLKREEQTDDKTVEPKPKELLALFNNCHSLLETELFMLHIQLIICDLNTPVVELLKSQYNVEEDWTTNIHKIKIQQKEINLVYWTDDYTSNQDIIEHLQSILKQKRDIPYYTRNI